MGKYHFVPVKGNKKRKRGGRPSKHRGKNTCVKCWTCGNCHGAYCPIINQQMQEYKKLKRSQEL